jgi:hypothetical protein
MLQIMTLLYLTLKNLGPLQLNFIPDCLLRQYTVFFPLRIWIECSDPGVFTTVRSQTKISVRTPSIYD